ncbi:MAG: glycosyltransferase [Acutalibacteraceae bacterium]
MKILYFGTVCDINNYQKLLEDCAVKPSVAPILFETALLDGFKKNGVDAHVYSFPMIPVFPKSKILFLKNITENLPCGFMCKWLNTVNIPVIKQISRELHAKRVIRKWCKENKNDGVIVTYSIPPFLAKAVTGSGAKYSKKTVAIVPDLPRDMYINDTSGGFVSSLKKLYLRSSIKHQGAYDGYVYLTDAMHGVVAPDKPYIVMEGIADKPSFDIKTPAKKSSPRAIMYAGMLNIRYGIINLLDAFENMNNTDAELWLFGTGTAVDEITARAKNNSRIKYFGQMNHEDIISYERKATLLVNPRDPEESFTKYSFPSKTIEYMLSGTPVLTTELKGIPCEYYNYVFSAKDNSAVTLKEKMDEILSLSDESLTQSGIKAQQFIIKEKSAESQSAKITKFIEDLCND